MANFRLITSLLSYTPSATSADADFPASNLSVLTPLAKAYKAAVATGVVDVTLDLGSGNTLSALAADPGIFIDDMNVTSIKLQANSSSSWASPPWDQSVTIAQCGDARRYKGYLRFADLNAAAVAYRYVNVRILSQTPTDGANYRIARIALGATTELLQNPLYDSAYELQQEHVKTKLFDGGYEVSLMGPRRLIATYPRKIWGTSEMTQEQTIQALSAGDPFVLWDSSRGNGGSQSAWLMRRTSDPRYVTTFLNMDDSTWVFEEYI
jgi:hypothetical protein